MSKELLLNRSMEDKNTQQTTEPNANSGQGSSRYSELLKM